MSPRRPLILLTFTLLSVLLTPPAGAFLSGLSNAVGVDPTIEARQSADPVPPGWRTLTREDLEEAGVTRLQDIFHLLENWNGRTVNGQDLSVTAGGLGLYDGDGPQIWIDGHPVSLSTPGWFSFTNMPISLLEIERVVIREMPGLHKGRFTDSGAIEIHTSREREGWFGYSRMAAGNEINDPGPYEFTPLNSPNEERLGPDLDLMTGYHGDRGYVEASGSITRHRSTDTPIEQRIKQMLYLGEATFAEPTNLKWTGRFNTGLETSAARINLRAGGMSYRDFPFIERLGREIPVSLELLHGGVDLERDLGEHTSLYMQTTWQRLNPNADPNRFDFAFDLRQSVRFWRMELNRDREVRRWSAGWSLNETSMRGDFAEAFHPVNVVTFYGSWSETVGDSFLITADASIDLSDDETASSAGLSADWSVRDNQRLRPWASYSERPPWRYRDLWFWMENGYGGLSIEEIAPQALPQRSPSNLTAAGIEWEWTGREDLRLRMEGALFRHRDLSLTRHRFRLVRPWQWLDHDGTDVATGEGINLLRLGSHLRTTLLPRLTQTLAVSLHLPVGAEPNSPARLLFAEHPARSLLSITHWEPVDGFELRGVLRATSRIAWDGFDEVDGELYMDQQQLDQGLYRRETGPVLNMDLGGRKWLWNRRMHLDLQINNLFNNAYFLYPVGADHELTFWIQLGLRF